MPPKSAKPRVPIVKGPDGRYHCQGAGCDRSYTDPRHVRLHYHSKHLGIRYPCPHAGCGAVYALQTSLRSHVKQKHERGGAAPRRRARKAARPSASPSRAQPPTSSATAETPRSATPPTASASAALHQCAACERVFGSSAALLRHAQSEHAFECCEPGLPLACRFGAESERALRAHIRASHTERDFYCPLCPKRYPWATAVARHLTAAHAGLSFPCALDGCPRVFGEFALFVRHRVADHQNLVGEPLRSSTRALPFSSSSSSALRSAAAVASSSAAAQALLMPPPRARKPVSARPPSLSLAFDDLMMPVAPPPPLDAASLLSSSSSRERRRLRRQERDARRKAAAAHKRKRSVSGEALTATDDYDDDESSSGPPEPERQRRIDGRDKRARVASSLLKR